MTSTPITAPDVVVRAWRAEATRTLAAAHRAADPLIVESLTRDAPREIAELVTYMSEALALASGLFMASVANATPAVPCPIPDPGGAAYPCECEPEGRAGCATIVADLAWVAVDNGCEGGVA